MASIGTGFFVAPHVLLTCNHVLNAVKDAHQSGDHYQLIQNLGNNLVKVTTPMSWEVGKEIILIPDRDAAIVKVGGDPKPFVSIDYRETLEGSEIGVAGYPLPKLSLGANGMIQFNGVYRVAKGVVTSAITQIIHPAPDPQTVLINTVEVNFLFVPGNSGGPIFDAETGRVLAFVHGFQNQEIIQRFVDTNADNVAAGAPTQHIEALHAIYSLGIKLDNLKTELQGFGVTL